MAKILIEQFVKEHDYDLEELEEELGWIEEPERFTYLIKFERFISKGRTEIKISYRDTRTNMDYKIIHESDKKEDYKNYIKFFKKNGYYKL
jgi:uncharacterized protein YecE (DUF72 family)